MGATTSNYDFVVVGAGIVGLSVAFELQKRYPGQRILVLEKENQLGCHASGRNSGVLHSGIYYSPQTLKAKMCARGANLMREFALQHRIPIEKRVKVIIPTNAEELPVLDVLFENAKNNGVQVERLPEGDIKRLEPYSNPFQKGLYIRDTAVIDTKMVLEAISGSLHEKGVEVEKGLKAIEISPVQKIVRTNDRQVGYGFLFNCAGAYADVLAHQTGVGRDYLLIPFKGMYYKLPQERAFMVKGNIYPVPNLRFPFLGVHFTRVISDQVYVGPTAIPCLGRENYRGFAGMRLWETAGIFWELTKLFIQNDNNFRGLVRSEIKNYVKSWYLQSARKLLPDLTIEDLTPTDKVGIRPQLVNIRTRKLELDFIIERADHSVHILNAISPAFTSAFAFAEYVVEMAKKGT